VARVAVPLILGVDPGKMTGFFHIAWPERWAEVPTNRVTATLREYHRLGIALIACEKFVLRPGKRAMTAQPDALEVMGVVRSFAADHDIPVEWCQPGAAKKMISNPRLRVAGWYVSTPDMHASDAARQAGRALAVHQPDVFAKVFRV
jgi:hypothetical protein